jgi:folate-binding protein YgfZ
MPAETHPLHAGAALVDLTGRGHLVLLGADRAQFLNGLVTNDVKKLTPGEGCDAAFLTPKGKMQAFLTVLCLEDRLVLDCDASLVTTLRDLIGTYIVFHPVRMLDETDATSVLHLEGPLSREVLARVGASPIPDATHGHAIVKANGVAATLVGEPRGGGDGFDLRLERTLAQGVREALIAAGGEEVDEADLDVARIEAGIPRWGRELDGTVLPDEAGLARTAISYTKGCYLGQETVARIRTYGHVNRNLVRLLLPLEPPVAPGAYVMAGEEKVGKITSVTASARLGRQVALAFVKREHAAPGVSLTVRGPEEPLDALVTADPFERGGG